MPGPKSDKVWADAVKKVCNDLYLEDKDGNPTDDDDKGKPVEVKDESGRVVKLKKINVLARNLVKKGLGGDVAAIKEVADRLDGKAPQEKSLNVNNTGTVTHEHRAVSTALDFLGQRKTGDEDGDTEGLVRH